VVGMEDVPLVPGQIREATEILTRAGIQWTIAMLDPKGRGGWMRVVIKRMGKQLAVADLGGIYLHWCKPVAIDTIHKGKVERQCFGDDDLLLRPNKVAYWGLPADLIDAGVTLVSRVQRGAKGSKGSDSGRWHSYFAPSGRVLHERWGLPSI